MIKLCGLFKHYSDEISYYEHLKFKLATHKNLNKADISILLFIINCRTDDIKREIESWNGMGK